MFRRKGEDGEGTPDFVVPAKAGNHEGPNEEPPARMRGGIL